MKPVIIDDIDDQPTFSWMMMSMNVSRINVWKTFHREKNKRQLDGNGIKRRIYLHAEMNILASIIDQKIKKGCL